MRKFARSIGSEGKSQGQQGRTVTALARPVRSAVLGFAPRHVATDRDVGTGGYLSEAVLLPVQSPLGTAAMPGGASKTLLGFNIAPMIANSELLTAGNPTV